MRDFYDECLKRAKENRKITDLSWDNNVEEILLQFAEILNGVLEGTEYYVERNSTIGEKNLDVFRKGIQGRIGHLWPRKRERVIHINFTTDIVEQLQSRMDMPEESEVKDGKKLNWRAYRGVDFETTMNMMKELSRIRK